MFFNIFNVNNRGMFPVNSLHSKLKWSMRVLQLCLQFLFVWFYKSSDSRLQKQEFHQKVEFSTFVFPTLYLMTTESLTVIVALTKLTVTKESSNTMQILQQKGRHVLRNLISLPALWISCRIGLIKSCIIQVLTAPRVLLVLYVGRLLHTTEVSAPT